MKVLAAVIVLYFCFGISESRRHPKIITSIQNANPQLHKKEFEYNEYEYPTGNSQPVVEESHENEESEQVDHHEHHESFLHAKHISSKKPGYSAGSGLRSIAQGSADQASSAVNNQHAAAKQAAFIAQNTLAQAASQAAATAQAALAGKQVLLQGLEQQSIEARQALESEIAQLQQAKRSAKAAAQAAQQALNHIQVLTAALNNAQTSAEHAQQSAQEAAGELASQQSMVGAAKQRVELVEEQLHAARIDFEATQHAATSAAASAQQAQNNASAAAVHAAIHLKEIPGEESVRHDDYATNHNYGGSGPSGPSPTSGSANIAQSTISQSDFDFAGYK
ncbi:uncharacterized protein LOC116346669 [Contarinia nasturtii]|uniref:uncharacterized protein LOC116346669 n=1 Tax=Contarinia nasturtii TaxID=265458 RepID=UPI0012D4B5E7|nr:uncharacterized protein LOC116346669 [Contarinia nasturtii]XP_031632706.1 uncharacterized protein LOC116346669 [Contarinia nasturtii]